MNRAFAFLDAPTPIAFAHRGGGKEREENTHAAFAHAVSLGFRYIETDIQASRDGVPVVIHDPTLERTFGRPERVEATTWRDLARFRSPGGERLPRLDEVFEAYPETRFNIEPKSDAAVEPVAEAIRRAGAIDRVCIGCFDGRRTRRLRRLLGEGLCWSPPRAGVAALWLAGLGLPIPALPFPAVQVPPAWGGIPVVTGRLLRAARARGIQVHVWTIDEEAAMHRLLDLGVDGIMTGRPGLLRQVLEGRGAWRPA
jgi:glycerophosphoryl diester phosphodiesterase